MSDPTMSAQDQSADITGLSRAAFLRRAGGTVLSMSALGLVACGGDDSETPPAAPEDVSGTINFFGWQGYDDKKAFKPLQARGVRLSPEYITTNDDIVTKLRGGGGGTIDVVTPFLGYLPALIAGDILEELDYGRIPSTEGFYPELVEATGRFGGGKTYAAPVVWGDTPMIMRPDLMPDLPTSWLDLRDPKYEGKLITLDDIYGNILIMSIALNGPDKPNELTSQQLDEVVSVWKEIKPNLVTFAPSYGDAADIIGRGDAGATIQGWRFVQQQLEGEGIEAEAHVPEEGTFAWADAYAIPKGAPNLDAAYAFIDTMLSPRGNALIGAATGSGVTSEAAREELPADQRNLYPYDDLGSLVANFYPLPLEPEGDYVAYDEWVQAWDEVKAA